MKNFMKAIGLFLLLPFVSMAQTDEDALRYSQLTFGGTARYMGLSGAFGAIGADFSTLSSNPAGIGLYRSSEFSFSPAVTGIHTETNFQGTVSTGQDYQFNISNFGIVISSDLTRRHPDNKWKRLNFGFGLNRLNDFNSETFYSGYNSSTSITDYYVEQANQLGGIDPNSITDGYPFGAGMFYQAYLINPDADNSNFYTTAIVDGDVNQAGSLIQDGSGMEYVFSIGSNYNDRVLLGMTLGLPTVRYNITNTYSEGDVNNVHEDFNDFTFTNFISTNGTGLNGKFGLSYIFNDALRGGLALHTPSYYWMHDNYSATIHSSLNSVGSVFWESPFGSYNYDLITPWKAIGSLAAYYKKVGFISVDYELVDYSSMRYHFKNSATPDEKSIENTLNQTIDQKYGMASNIRVGAEVAYEVFRIRAGAAYYGSPFLSGVAADGSDFDRWSFSGGAGIRGNHVFFDAAYVRSTINEFYQPYNLVNQQVPGAEISKTTNNVVATIGVKF